MVLCPGQTFTLFEKRILTFLCRWQVWIFCCLRACGWCPRLCIGYLPFPLPMSNPLGIGWACPTVDTGGAHSPRQGALQGVGCNGCVCDEGTIHPSRSIRLLREQVGTGCGDRATQPLLQPAIDSRRSGCTQRPQAQSKPWEVDSPHGESEDSQRSRCTSDRGSRKANGGNEVVFLSCDLMRHSPPPPPVRALCLLIGWAPTYGVIGLAVAQLSLAVLALCLLSLGAP